MSQSLSQWQSVALGLVVIAALGLGGYGIARIAEKQGLWSDSFEISAGFPDAHDITSGTVVRIRGVDAGQVVAIEYPDHDGPGAEVTVRMRLNGKFASRIYADANAQIYGSGLLGAKVIAVNPGTTTAGPLTGSRVPGLKSFGTEEAIAEFRDTAGEVRKLATQANGLVKDVRDSNGTLMKLVKDDDLHNDIKALVAKTDKAVGNLDTQATGIGVLVQEGRDTLRSVKQGTDAISKMPLIRNYVEDTAAILVRPGHKRDESRYMIRDLFEPGTANLTPGGVNHLSAQAGQIKLNTNKASELVIAVYCDPADKTQTPASALELTKKQAERIADHMKALDVHKLGILARRKITTLGMGITPSPVVEKDPLPPAVVQILLFTPQ